MGINQSVEKEVVQLAALVQQAGLDGVVASPLEIKPLRETCGADMVIVTPGVRPSQGRRHDQARVMTPAEAIHAGADYLVVGRPIKEAPDPLKATQEILQEIRSAQ
jgi:orotidine-5'-phosphate decarboxylase